ncbi:MAG TPA: hypothetical protein VN788_17520 [Verrucomicrobiae bacterium]|nr:hypothetical protein [Bryobacteraceae bacterium]HXU22382.1 hypothetical protein [Verrucomicrobiae bacterium]
MSASCPDSAAIHGSEGDLVLISVSVDPKLLEDFLDALAGLDFPVNPQLYHHPGSVAVEFPAYKSRVDEVRETLVRRGFDAAGVRVAAMLEAIAGR